MVSSEPPGCTASSSMSHRRPRASSVLARVRTCDEQRQAKMSFLFGQFKERQYRNRYLSLSSEDSDWVLSSQISDKAIIRDVCVLLSFFKNKIKKVKTFFIFALKIKGCFGAVELSAPSSDVTINMEAFGSLDLTNFCYSFKPQRQ